MIYKLMERDELVLHKVGLILGTLLGILLGMFVSEKADAAIYEEVDNAKE